MFRRVLVPVDFTDRSIDAVDVAGRLTDEDGGAVTLIHVVQKVPGLNLESDPGFYDRLEAAATKEMAALGKRLEDEGIDWSALLIVGNRCDEIIKAAENDVDVVVVSSHRVDFNSPETGAGTMSYRIAVTAPCPVLLLK